jgi:XTP/dITP diphosphohydrolase
MNPDKRRELTALLSGDGWSLRDLGDYPDVEMPPETGRTFAENAIMKAEAVCAATGQWALADDSGLCVDVLGGAPGVISARYGGSEASTPRNNSRLLADLINVGPNGRSAAYVAVLALARPNAPTLTTRGICRGIILATPQGTGGFGYDPLFYLPRLGRAMAEITAAEKSRISHRARAACTLQNLLSELVRT